MGCSVWTWTKQMPCEVRCLCISLLYLYFKCAKICVREHNLVLTEPSYLHSVLFSIPNKRALPVRSLEFVCTIRFLTYRQRKSYVGGGERESLESCGRTIPSYLRKLHAKKFYKFKLHFLFFRKLCHITLSEIAIDCCFWEFWWQKRTLNCFPFATINVLL